MDLEYAHLGTTNNLHTHTYLVSWNAWFHTAYPHDVVLTETLAGNACVLEAIRSGSETPVDEDFGSLDEDFGILRMMPQTPSEHRGSKISCLWSDCNTELDASHTNVVVATQLTVSHSCHPSRP